MSIIAIDTRSPLRYSDNAATALELGNPLDQGELWARARCAETDPEAFFPEKGESSKTAKAVCNRDEGCPIKDQCREWALANNERFGIWGGLSERERRKIIADRDKSDQPDAEDQRPAA